jgi:Ca2+-binding RTX toxin-like protein
MRHCANRLSLGLTGALLGVALVASTALALTITGTSGNDRIRGSQQDDTIDALAGDDRVIGRAGNDTIDGDGGADRLFGNAGNDKMLGHAGPDRLHGGRGNDVLEGDAPNAGDTVSRDRLFGGQGHDTLTGGDGRDRLHGGPGNDKAVGNGGRDFMSGGFGDDEQHGGPGNDRIFANPGRDITFGGDGDDDLWALARRDVNGPNDTEGDILRGEGGNDRIHLRDGEQDIANCGEGTDVALLDFKDKIEDASDAIPNGSCEVVRRHAPRPHDTRAEDRTQSPSEDRREG